MTDAAVPAAAATPALSQAAAARSKRPRYDRSIVEGPLLPAVWKLAWPTMLTNIVGGLQGMVDQALVGNLIGYKANAAIGVSMQMWLIVMIFISSLFSGMSVLVARFAGAGDHDKVDRTVYQAFITAIGLAVLIMAPIGYFAAPYLLNFVNAAPEVQRDIVDMRAEAAEVLQKMVNEPGEQRRCGHACRGDRSQRPGRDRRVLGETSNGLRHAYLDSRPESPDTSRWPVTGFGPGRGSRCRRW